jgi:hypothetical protein
MREAKKILRQEAAKVQARLDEEYRQLMAPIEAEKAQIAKELTILKARLMQGLEEDFRGFAIIYARLHKINAQEKTDSQAQEEGA